MGNAIGEPERNIVDALAHDAGGNLHRDGVPISWDLYSPDIVLVDPNTHGLDAVVSGMWFGFDAHHQVRPVGAVREERQHRAVSRGHDTRRARIRPAAAQTARLQWKAPQIVRGLTVEIAGEVAAQDVDVLSCLRNEIVRRRLEVDLHRLGGEMVPEEGRGQEDDQCAEHNEQGRPTLRSSSADLGGAMNSHFQQII